MINDMEVNKIYEDEFGRVSGIFAVDKEINRMSHDLVYDYRRKFNTKKVGHAGTLDPFASGLLIILVGKATKLSDKFLTMDKEYIAEIALGITTETLDPEGTIAKQNSPYPLSQRGEDEIRGVLKSFQPEYNQYVPVYSSVKVQGNKLRELARKTDNYEIVDIEDGKLIEFYKNNDLYKEVELPRKNVKIYEIELIKSGERLVEDITLDQKFKEQLEALKITKLNCITIRVKCSKGTYIRKLAEDIGNKLNIPTMLVGLRRTKVGDISLEK